MKKNITQLTDSEILTLLIDTQSELYLTELYTRYHTDIFKFIKSMNMNLNEMDIYDIVQETFLTLYYKIHTLKDRKKFKSWLFQVARRHFLSFIRKNKLNKKLPLSEILYQNLEDKHNFVKKIENLDYFKKVEIILEKFLISLPERERLLVILRIYHGKTYHECAEILNWSERKTVYKYQQLSKKLRLFLKKNNLKREDNE